MPTCVNLLTETKETAARFFSSEQGDKSAVDMSFHDPGKIPGTHTHTHTWKDQGSSRLISQRISDLHGLIIDQHCNAGRECSMTAFGKGDLHLSECWLKKKMFAIVNRNRIEVLNAS